MKHAAPIIINATTRPYEVSFISSLLLTPSSSSDTVTVEKHMLFDIMLSTYFWCNWSD